MLHKTVHTPKPTDVDTDTTTAANDQRHQHLSGDDLELCFFVTHDIIGCSIEEKRIVIIFQGTCKLLDLLTNASIIQEAWVLGENVENDVVIKVYFGFR